MAHSGRRTSLLRALILLVFAGTVHNARSLASLGSAVHANEDQTNSSVRDAGVRSVPSDIPRRGGFPLWPAGEGINATTVLAWLDFAAMDARIHRTFGFENWPTHPAVVVRNNDGRYVFAYSGPVAETLPSATSFRRGRIAPTESIFHEAINHFDGGDSIDGLPLAKLYQLLDDGVPIPLVFDITDMQQCATNYSAHWGPVHFEKLPVWSHSIRVDCKHAFGLPGYGYLGGLRRNETEWDVQFQVWDAKYPWEMKQRIAVWRGTTSGMGWRQRMLEVTAQSPLVDARVVTGKDRTAAIPFVDFQKYRAVLDVDGNAWSERFPKLLCMNVPVIKVAPQWLDYHDFTAEPFVHFVPAPLNESLIDAVNWTLAPENEAAVRGIVQNARARCRESMLRERVMEDLVFQLAAYLELLDRDSPGWTERFVEWRNSTSSRKLFPGLSDGQLRPLTIAR
ncbi:hypothetical protein ACHAXT_001661 [Thalassiosira profunda]